MLTTTNLDSDCFFSSTNLQLFRAPCYDFFSRETWAKDICRGFYCQPIQQEPLVPPSADAVRKAGESVSASAPTFPGQVGSRPGEDGFIWVLKPCIWIYMDLRSIWIYMDLKRFIFCLKGMFFFHAFIATPKIGTCLIIVSVGFFCGVAYGNHATNAESTDSPMHLPGKK